MFVAWKVDRRTTHLPGLAHLPNQAWRSRTNDDYCQISSTAGWSLPGDSAVFLLPYNTGIGGPSTSNTTPL